MRILAVDPGPATGFCLYDDEIKSIKKEGLRANFESWIEPLHPRQQHLQVYNILESTDFDKLIVEKFEFRKDDQARDKIDYMAAEIVGVCKVWAQQEWHQRGAMNNLIMQGSSLIGKTAFWSDDNKRVKQLGLYDSKVAPHGMDAMRHLLYYLSFTLNQTEWFRKLDDRH